MRAREFALASALASAMASPHTALFDRGGGFIYDADLNVTWLSDANYAKTSGFDTADVAVTWDTAMTWAANLTLYDSVRGQSLTGWRLPTTLLPDASCSFTNSGYNCTGSELGRLFYEELGGVALQDIASTHNTNYGLFQNIQSNYYWSGTEAAGAHDAMINAWYYLFTSGSQNSAPKDLNFSVMLLRDGDVATAVPEPESFAMTLASLGLCGLVARRRRNKQIGA